MTATDFLKTLENYFGSEYTKTARELISAKLHKVSERILPYALDAVLENDTRLPLWASLRERIYMAYQAAAADAPPRALAEPDSRDDPRAELLLNKLQADLRAGTIGGKR